MSLETEVVKTLPGIRHASCGDVDIWYFPVLNIKQIYLSNWVEHVFCRKCTVNQEGVDVPSHEPPGNLMTQLNQSGTLSLPVFPSTASDPRGARWLRHVINKHTAEWTPRACPHLVGHLCNAEVSNTEKYCIRCLWFYAIKSLMERSLWNTLMLKIAAW